MFTRTDDKITTTQASIFISSSVLGAGILTLPRSVVSAAKTPDVWLSILISGVIVILMAIVMAKLSQKFPEKTIFQYASNIVGAPLAFIVSTLLLIYFIMIAGFELRVLAEVTMFYLLEGTPIWAIIIPFVWLSGYLLFGGINAIARLLQIIFPISILVLIITYLLSLKIFDIDQLRPFLGEGLLPVINGLKSTVLVFSGFEVTMFLIAHMQHPKQAIKAVVTGLGIPVCIYLFTLIFVVGGLSVDAVLRSTWPTIDLLRSFEISGLFFERLEFPFMVIWTMQMFSNFTCYYYGASLGISQLIKVNISPVILGLMPFIYLSAMIPKRSNDIFAVGDFIGWSSAVLFVIIPLPLYLIWLIRSKGLKQHV